MSELKRCGCGRAPSVRRVGSTEYGTECECGMSATSDSGEIGKSVEIWNAAMSGGNEAAKEYRARYQAVVKAFQEAYPSLVPSLENIQEVFHGVADWYKQQAEKVKRIAELEAEIAKLNKQKDQYKAHARQLIKESGVYHEQVSVLGNLQDLVQNHHSQKSRIAELEREAAKDRALSDAERYYEALQALARDHCGSDDIAALLEELRFLRSEKERPAAEFDRAEYQRTIDKLLDLARDQHRFIASVTPTYEPNVGPHTSQRTQAPKDET